jgi:putative transposase
MGLTGRLRAEFDRVAEGAGTRVIKTAVRAPLMNSVVERFLRSVRRECLDHVIIVGEHHLDSVLREYGLQYFNTLRPHQGIGQQVPVPSVAPGTACPDPRRVVARPILGGLHHDYQIAA